jgi:hypothetical protein
MDRPGIDCGFQRMAKSTRACLERDTAVISHRRTQPALAPSERMAYKLG